MADTSELITIPYAPRRQFLPLHNRKERFAAIVAHRRAGKTVAEINEDIREALTCQLPNPRIGYIAPYYKQAKSLAWQYLKDYSMAIPGSKVNESELRVDYPNGGQVRLFGADNPDAIRGVYFDKVTLDEPADMNPRFWPEIIRPTLVDRRGKATFIGTPKGRNSFHAICENAKNNPEWFYMMLRASETGIIPPDELLSTKADMTPEQYEQEFECSFEAAIIGAYYGRELAQADAEGRVRLVEYDKNALVHTAWDLGYGDDTAIWFYQVVMSEIRVIGFYFASGRDIDHYAQKIKSYPYEYGTHWLPHDAKAKTLASNGKSIQEQLANHLGWSNIRIVPNLSLADGIQAARKMMPKVYFDAKACHDGLEALRQYQRKWDDDRKCFMDTPKHDWTSHPADAFRYLAIAWQEDYKTGIQKTSPRDPYGDDEESSDWKTS